MNPLKAIWNFLSGVAKKIKEALTIGKNVANDIKNVADSPLLDVIANLTVTGVDNLALLYVRNALKIWIDRIGWADKKVSDFDETTLPHVMNAISAEASKLTAEFKGLDLSRQQAIASAQIIYNPDIVKV